MVIYIIFNHPDFGTAVLYLGVFSAMIIIAGMPWVWLPVLIGIGGLMLTVAFFTLGHVHRRIISFFTGTGDTYQVDNSVDAISHGGLFGSGDDHRDSPHHQFTEKPLMAKEFYGFYKHDCKEPGTPPGELLYGHHPRLPSRRAALAAGYRGAGAGLPPHRSG